MTSIFQLFAGLLCLYFGGEFLVSGASAIARRFSVSPLVIGLTLVSMGTSAPELAVSLNAAMSANASDISLANVVGSNIANIGLILGLSVIIMPLAVQARLFRVDAPVMILATLAVIWVVVDRQVTRAEGTVLVIALVLYVSATLWMSLQGTAKSRALAEQQVVELIPEPTERVWLQPVLVIADIVLLVLGGKWLVDGAVSIATALGVTPRVIGLTIVAVGTSLPELSTSVISAWRGYGNMAIGNIIGSNIFNVFGILGLTTIIQPLTIHEFSWLDHSVMAGLSLLLLFFLYTKKSISRLEGIILCLVYLAYNALLLIGS